MTITTTTTTIPSFIAITTIGSTSCVVHIILVGPLLFGQSQERIGIGIVCNNVGPSFER